MINKIHFTVMLLLANYHWVIVFLVFPIWFEHLERSTWHFAIIGSGNCFLHDGIKQMSEQSLAYWQLYSKPQTKILTLQIFFPRKLILYCSLQMSAISFRPQHVNSLWPRNTIWWHRPWSPLVKLMACCLTVPSQYQKQHLHIIKDAL